MKQPNQRGISGSELLAAVAVLAIGIVAVVLIVRNVPSDVKSETLGADIANVEKAIGMYALESKLQGRQIWPTEGGNLPPSGQTAPIDWDAEFVHNGTTIRFYPDFLKQRPSHWDEVGVWQIDSSGKVIVDLDGKEY